MEFTENEAFNEVVKKFKLLTLEQKKEVSINEIKDLLSFMNDIMKNKPVKKDVLYNKEILDMETKDNTNDDYAEAIYVYTMMIKELLASYVDYSERKIPR